MNWILAAGCLTVAAGAEAPSFVRDVMPVLARAGCNSGPCHGNQNGKGGFKLSLRGQDPGDDFARLTREAEGRRIDRVDPAQSLLLAKPTALVPHEGGRRFLPDAPEYETLLRWIAAGAPGPNLAESPLVRLEVEPPQAVLHEPQRELQLAVTAVFADGSRRDVTRQAVYEPTVLLAEVHDGHVERRGFGETNVVVRYLHEQACVPVAFLPEIAPAANVPAANFPAPVANYIDRRIDEKLATLHVAPTGLCDDRVFLRRATLDLLGLPPTADEAHAFLADADPDKRTRLVDRLLGRPEFAETWALKWSDLLRNEEKVLDDTGVARFHAWMREGFAAGKPLDQFVRELLVARGSTYEHPPANFYRAQRDPTTRGETVARLFLGVRLACAKCHNHPFDRWSQDDYYAWSALFARIDYKIVDNQRTDKLDKHEFVGDQIVLVADQGELRDPRHGRDVAPRFLGAAAPDLAPSADRLPPLAEWLTAPANRAFARTQANFIWKHLLGRGLVEPIDDFRATNPPTHPALLEGLADELIASGFDLRRLVRTIMASAAYQRATGTADELALTNYAVAVPRRLPAEQLLDAQCQALDAPATFLGYPRGTRAGQIPGVRKTRKRDERDAEGDRFLRAFGKPDRLLACDCERSNETSLNQAFLFIGGKGLQERLAESGNRLDRLRTASDDEAIDGLYWSALSRPPTDAERDTARKHLQRGDRQEALQDLAWAVIHAAEFVFRP